MKHTLIFSGAAIEIDPLGKWPEVHCMRTLADCGALPRWFLDYVNLPEPKPKYAKTIVEHMGHVYGFGLFPMKLSREEELGGSKISKEGIHTYPGDPPMFPLLKMKAIHSDEEMIQWESGIVAFRDKPTDEWYLTRMD